MDRRAFLTAAAASSLLSASAHQEARAQQALSRFGEAAALSAARNGAAFLVARHGVVLAEDYPDAGPATRRPIGAGTRMFAPLMAASLIDDRMMSLDEPVALTIGDWGAHPLKQTISIRALLNGTSGVFFAPRAERTLASAIAMEPGAAPGERFSSDSAAYLIFSEIVRRKLEASGRAPDPARYLTERTLAPIGAVPIGWGRTADGTRLDDGVEISARSWAQAGELIRRLGVWRAQRLADERTLQEAMLGSFAEPRAGFGFWLGAPGRGGELDVQSDLWRARSPAPPDLAMAAGAGGQRLYISPSSGLVVVRQSRSQDDRAPWSDAQFLTLIFRDLY